MKDLLKKNALGGAKIQMGDTLKLIYLTLRPLPLQTNTLSTQYMYSQGYCCEHYSGRSNSPLKSPLCSGKEIHSSRGCMCQISLVAALTTAESSPPDVYSGVNDHYIVFLCSGHKTMPSVHRKANRRNRFHGQSLFSAVFVKQEDWALNASAMCSSSCIGYI